MSNICTIVCKIVVYQHRRIFHFFTFLALLLSTNEKSHKVEKFMDNLLMNVPVRPHLLTPSLLEDNVPTMSLRPSTVGPLSAVQAWLEAAIQHKAATPSKKGAPREPVDKVQPYSRFTTPTPPQLLITSTSTLSDGKDIPLGNPLPRAARRTVTGYGRTFTAVFCVRPATPVP